MKNFHKKTGIYFVTLFAIYVLSSFQLQAQTYTWQGADGADWTVSTNWNPERVTPAITDELLFNNGGAYTVTNVPTQDIAQLHISNNTDVSFESSASITLTIRGVASNVNFSIESGSTLQLSSTGANRIYIIYDDINNQLGEIHGTLIVNANDAKNNEFRFIDHSAITTVENGGKIINKGGIITGATTRLHFLDGSEYRHDCDGLAIPTATWEDNSLVNVTGIINTRTTTGMGQGANDFGHVTWNCPNQNADVIFTNTTYEGDGNLTIVSTGTGRLVFTDASNRYITVRGDFVLQNGDVDFCNNGAGYARLYVQGDFLHSGGSLQRGTSTGLQYIYFNSQSVAKQYLKTGGTYNADGIRYYSLANAILNINSDLEIATSRLFYCQNNSIVTLNANLTGTGKYYIESIDSKTHLGTNINTTCEIENRGKLYLYDYIITGTGDFDHQNTSNATLYIGHADGIAATANAGNVQVSGTRYYGDGANYTYNGTVAQTTGDGLDVCRDLTIDNSAGVTLSRGVNMSSTASILYLTDGLLELGDYNLQLRNPSTTLAVQGSPSSSNMIVTNGTGYFEKYFNTNEPTAFEFPVGDNVGTVEYTPATVGFATNNGGYVGINLTDDVHPDLGAATDYLTRYWSFTTTMSDYDHNIVFNYIDPDDIVGGVGNMRVSRYEGGLWYGYNSTIGAGQMEITSSPLYPINASLNGTDYTALDQEIQCESNNGLLYETFPSSALPTGWTRGRPQGSYDWQIKNSPGLTSASGGYYAVFDDWSLGSGVTPNEAWIATPTIDFCGLTSIYLSYYEYWYGVENTFGYVELSTDDGATWTIINTNEDVTVGDLSAANQTVIDLTPYLTGYTSVKIRFRYLETSAVGRYWYIDDINIYAGDDVGVAELVEPQPLACAETYTNSEQIVMKVYNYSFETVTNVDWTCDVTGGTTANFSGTIPSIPGNSYIDLIVGTIDMSADDVYHFNMNADVQAPDIDGNQNNNTLKVGRRQLVQTYPYLADFNTSTDGWTETGQNPQPINSSHPDNNGREFEWGELPYLGGHDGEGSSWYVKTTTSYKSDWIYVESPAFDFSEINNPMLSMDIKYQLTNYNSQFHVEYTLNDGANWYQLGSSSEPNWYQGNANWWYDNFNSPVDTWTHVEHLLCELSGESCVKFRIFGYAYYGINGSTDYRDRNFFVFDNFAISEGDPDDIEPVALTLTSSRTCSSFGAAENMQLLINNNTCRPITNIPVTIQIDGGAVINEVAPGPIARNSSYLYDFTASADLSTAGNHTIVATTALTTDGVVANNTLTEKRINDKIVVDGVSPYIQDFESGNDGWVSRVNSATDGTRHFRLGEVPYLNGEEGNGTSYYTEVRTAYNSTFFWVETPVFDLSAASDPVLFMDIKYQFATYNSQIHVEYSKNGGTNWTQLGTSADPDWYEGNTNWWYDNYSDPQDEWQTVQHSLCDIMALTPAEKACIKFRISGYHYYGPTASNSQLIPGVDYSDRNRFAFDNFKIIDAPEVGVTAILDPNSGVSGCLYDQNQSVTIEVENYGCGTVYNVPVKVQIDLPVGHPDYALSPLLFTGSVPEITGNSSATYTFASTFDMTPMGIYDFDAWSEMPGDVSTANDHAYSTISVDFPKITTYPFLEDFNANDGYWVAYGQNPPDNNGRNFVWGELPYLDGAEGEGNSWYIETTSAYHSDWICVESPVFDFSNISNPVLYMDIKYQFTTYNSQAHVEYSLNGGGTWTQLGNNTDPNWYQGDANWWYNNFASPVADWTEVQRDLCELAGEPCVKFRVFAYAYYGISGTNDYRDRNYFAMDNFRIEGGLSDDAEPIHFTLNNSGICGAYSNTETLQILVNNNLCRPLYDVPVTINVDGTDIATEIIPGPIPRFGSFLYTISQTADLSTNGNHTLTATVNLASDTDNSNDVHSEIRINNTPISVSPGNDYEEDFNSGNGGWVSRINSATDATRHFRLDEVPYLNGPEGEGDSWYVETTTAYNSTYIWVESPIFDLSSAVNPILQMDIKYQLTSYNSQFHVEYSKNGGTSWTQIGTSADPDWYEGNTNWWYNNYATPQDAWKLVQHKLCDLIGEPCVKFRISGYAYYGPLAPNGNLIDQTDYSDRNYFAFDNFKIVDAQDVGVTAILDPDPADLGCLYSDAQTVTVTVYNWSCNDAIDVPVVVEITGAATATFNGIVPTVPAGGSTDFTFTGTFDMTPIGTYNFNSYTAVIPDANPSNDATVMSITVPFPKITSFPYIADFDADGNYWLAGGQNPPDNNGRNFVHGTLPYLDGPEGEGDCWYVETTSAYHSDYIYVESPVFDFSGLSEPFLMMDIKYQFTTYNSQMHVEYSLNGGASWTQLGNSNDPYWYEGVLNWWYNNYANPVDDWKKVFHNLCSFAGEPCVKFRIFGYAYYGDTGSTDYSDRNYFAFDNFEIIDGFQDASVSRFLTPVPNEAPCTFPEETYITVEVKGASCSDLVDVPIYCDIEGPYAYDYNLSGTVTIPANTTQTYTFPTPVDLRAVGSYNFDAYTDLTGDNYPTNDHELQTVTTLDTLINTFPYYADFNDGKQYWREGNNTTPQTRWFELGQFDYLNGNETNGDAWFVTTTTNGRSEFIWVESPIFDFTDLDNPILSFEVKYQLHNWNTQFHVEYSTNGGLNWTQLGTNADPNWYVGNTNWWYNNVQAPVNDWTYVEHNLCNLKGQSCVKFRISGYAYYGGVSKHYNFFAFDNIAITDTNLDVALSNVWGCYGTEYQLEAEVTNRNNFCQLFDPCSFDGQTAIQFDNSNDRVELGAMPELTNFTVEYWINNPADGVGDHRMSVVAESNRFETVKMNGGLLYFYMPTTGWVNTGRTLPVGEWSHVAVTSDGTNLYVYLNGEEIYTRAGSYTIAASNWYLGARSNSSYPTNAALDEVRIWSKALTGDEVRAGICGTATAPQADLVAYYNMEDGTGSTTLTDLSGNGHTGTLTNMDENTCWISSDLATNNGGVATDPAVITNVDICYELDGATTCNTYPVNIAADATETVIIPNILIPNGLNLSDNLCTGGTASASHTLGGSSPDNAFDGNIATSGWYNTNVMPCWLEYDLGAGNEQTINVYRLYASSTETPGSISENTNPGTWIFQASNDGTNWDDLDNVYYGNMSMNTWATFNFENTTPYRYYRIFNTYAENSNSVHITELQMFNSSPDPSSLVVWVENPNGVEDQIPMNDTVYVDVAQLPHCNDNCEAAVELTNAVTSASSNANATPNPFEDPSYTTSGCGGVTLENTSWYYFTTNCRGGEVKVTFDNIVCSPGGTGLQVAITRLDAEPVCDPANHTEVFCAYPGDEQDIVWNPMDLLPDTEYYITIDGVSGNTCDFKILLEGNVAFNPADAMTNTAGSYMIDMNAGTGYTSIQQAIDSLETYGINSPIEFELIDQTFNEQLVLPLICGTSYTNTITFRTYCDDCAMATIEATADATDNYTVQLDWGQFYVFDRVKFKANDPTYSRVVDITNRSNNNVFQNCVFEAPITAGNSDDNILVYSNIDVIEERISNHTFENSLFTNGSQALFFDGIDASTLTQGLEFNGNTLNNQSYRAFTLINTDAPIVTNNELNTSSTRTDFAGLYMQTADGNTTIAGNKLYASTASGKGIFLDDVSGDATDQVEIYNNMVSLGSGANATYAMDIVSTTGSTEYLNLYYNSFNNLATAGSAFRVNTANNFDLKNNIFGSASATSYDITSLTASTEDYNNFFPDFAGKGANSVNINPSFLANDDLHSENASLQAGTPIAGITTDIDGETRDAVTPFIGADEFLGIVSWTGNTDTDWNKATNWSSGQIPTEGTTVRIPTTPIGGNFPETNSNPNLLAECRNMTIDAGSHLWIEPAKYLTIHKDLTQNGELTLKSDQNGNASLITYGNVVNGAGSTTQSELYLSVSKWHYLSSPITNADANLFSFTEDFYWFDETIADSWNGDDFAGGIMGWTQYPAGAMPVGRGYAYRTEPSGDQTILFTGEHNNSDVTLNLYYTDNTGTHGDLKYDGWNLIGNPYPSSLNWNDESITKTNVDNAIYVYADNGSGAYNNYLYYVAASPNSPYPSIALNQGTCYVPPMQGFFVRANAPGASVQLTNQSRTHSDAQFYKNEKADETQRIFLQIENGDITDQTALRFIPEATDDYDGEFDAFKLFSTSANVPQIYFVDEGSFNFAINTLSEITDNLIVPVGVKVATAGEYRITVPELNLDDNVTAYFRDTELGTMFEITPEFSYSLYANAGHTTDRFEIVFATDRALQGMEENVDLNIYSHSNNIYIKAEAEYLQSHVEIYNFIGQKVYEGTLLSTHTQIPMQVASGNYLVKIVKNDKVITEKVFVGDYK